MTKTISTHWKGEHPVSSNPRLPLSERPQYGNATAYVQVQSSRGLVELSSFFCLLDQDQTLPGRYFRHQAGCSGRLVQHHADAPERQVLCAFHPVRHSGTTHSAWSRGRQSVREVVSLGKQIAR